MRSVITIMEVDLIRPVKVRTRLRVQPKKGGQEVMDLALVMEVMVCSVMVQGGGNRNHSSLI